MWYLLVSWKNDAFLFLSLQIVTYSWPVPQVLCRIIECPAKCTSFGWTYYTRTPGLLENEPVLISGKIIWEKNKSPVRKTFLYKAGQPMSTSSRRGKKERLFFRKSPSDYFWILRLFSFRTEEGRRAYVEDEMKFYKEALKKTLIVL